MPGIGEGKTVLAITL